MSNSRERKEAYRNSIAGTHGSALVYEANREARNTETKSHLALIAKLARALSEVCEMEFADEEYALHIEGHGTYTIGDLLDEADKLLENGK